MLSSVGASARRTLLAQQAIVSTLRLAASLPRLATASTSRLNSSSSSHSSSSSSPPSDDKPPSSPSSSTASAPSASAASKPITKPVQISYVPSKSGSGGGSLTLNLPPHLLSALKSQAAASTSKAKSKPASASASAAKARAAREEAHADPTRLGSHADTLLHHREAAAARRPDATSAATARKHISEVFAWATAYQYDFNALISSGRLPAGWKWLEDKEVIYIPSWPSHSLSSSSSFPSSPFPSFSSPSSSDATPPPPPPPTGHVFIFRSGSYITWGLSLSHSRRFMRQVIQGRDLKHVVERAPYTEMGDEAMECLHDPTEVTRIRDGLIVLGKSPLEDGVASESSIDATTTTTTTTTSSSTTTTSEDEWTSLLAMLAFSQGLATSARLSVQETALSNFLSSVSTIPLQLETTGRVPLTRAQVIRQMGTLLRLRQKANLDRDNFYDEPEVYWDNARMEEHFRSICTDLDISSRFETLNEKLDICENLLGVVRALKTESTTHRMELVIIALIAFEVGIALLSHGWIPEWLVEAWNGGKQVVGGAG